MTGAVKNEEGVLRRKVMKALLDRDDALTAAEVARLAGCGTQRATSVLEALMVNGLTTCIATRSKGRVRRLWRLTDAGVYATSAAVGKAS